MAIGGAGEDDALLGSGSRNETTFFSVVAKGGACLTVAVPTAVLNSLAVVAAQNPTALSHLHSPADLAALLHDAGPLRAISGAVVFLGSVATLFNLNRKYLLPSLQAAGDVIRRDLLSLRRVVGRVAVGDEGRVSAGENFLFCASLFTSLIFAELGSKAFAFLGAPGKVTGFSLNLLVYFATRYAGALIFFGNFSDLNAQLKERYSGRLELLAGDEVNSVLVRDGDVDAALTHFLRAVDDQWSALPKDFKRVFWLQYAAPVLGYSLAAALSVPVWAGLGPEGVQGFNALFHARVGEATQYRDPGTLTLSTFITALTLLFYAINIKDLPKHFFRTAISMYEKIQSGDKAGAMKLLGLTILSFSSSYVTGLGFKLVADIGLASGFFDYLPGWLARAIPDGLLTAVVTMLWSHLQELVNQVGQQSIDASTVTSVDLTNAKALLRESETDVSSLGVSKLGWFARFWNGRRSSGDVEAASAAAQQGIGAAPSASS